MNKFEPMNFFPLCFESWVQLYNCGSERFNGHSIYRDEFVINIQLNFVLRPKLVFNYRFTWRALSTCSIFQLNVWLIAADSGEVNSANHSSKRLSNRLQLLGVWYSILELRKPKLKIYEKTIREADKHRISISAQTKLGTVNQLLPWRNNHLTSQIFHRTNYRRFEIKKKLWIAKQLVENIWPWKLMKMFSTKKRKK